MKVISEADLVLAMGTRLGPFGSLPQYNVDYWPREAQIIQVEASPEFFTFIRCYRAIEVKISPP